MRLRERVPCASRRIVTLDTGFHPCMQIDSTEPVFHGGGVVTFLPERICARGCTGRFYQVSVSDATSDDWKRNCISAHL
jgi:hypothetical protein